MLPCFLKYRKNVKYPPSIGGRRDTSLACSPSALGRYLHKFGMYVSMSLSPSPTH